MKNWKHVSILLTLERVEAIATLNNIKGVILDAMGGYGGLIENPWLPNEFALNVIMIQCFMAFGLGRLHKQGNKLPFTLLMCIVWHIEPT